MPAILFGGLPRLGCLCADGHFEANCPSMMQASAIEGNATCCGEKSCCNLAGTNAKSCCAAQPAASPTNGASGLAPQSCSNCCRPLWQAPNAPLKSKGVEDLPELLPQPVVGLAVTIPHSPEQSFVSLDCGRYGPPIDDLVIVLRRLTI